MTFIERITPFISSYAAQYGFGVVSAIVAQAILESANGTSELAVHANNFFGLKHSKGRCPTATGVYAKKGSEQLPDGSYVSGDMLWCKFPTMEAGVQGYFDFLKNGWGRYDNLIGITDPQAYLETIRADGYATSLDYVKKVWAVLLKYDLRRYDEEKEMATRSYSPLCGEIVAFGKNCNPRKNPVSKITIHHMAGVMDAGNCARMHLRSSGSSANYYIGNDGKICGGVNETMRAWTSGTGDGKNTNDHMAITIEVSNSQREGMWPVSAAAYKSMIALCADICTFYGIVPRYDGTKNGTLTTHKMFQSTACPGPYLDNLHRSGQIERDILEAMGRTPVTPTPEPATEPVLLRVQTGAYRDKQNAFNRLAELRDKGVDGIVVLADDGLYKVQVGAYSKQENAHNKALELQQKGFATFLTDKGGTMISENAQKTYIVQTGDTLGGIAGKHGTTVQKIVAANGILNPNMIHPGQKLVIT